MANMTSKKLAKKLGVSETTVSFALNGKDGISEKTRNMVLNAALENGMTLHTNDIRIANFQSKTICYLVITDKYIKSGEHSMFESLVLYGVDNAAHALGYNTLVKYIDVRNLLDKNILDFLAGVDGLIILATDINAKTAGNMRELMQIVKDVPKVILDNMILAEEEDSIGNDNFLGGSIAAKTLIESGCKKIGYLKSKTRLLNFDEREAGLKDALKKQNMSLFTTVEIGISSTKAHFDMTNWLKNNPELPDAFFADNDVLAISALRALRTFGYSAPDDISIIGFDDIPMANMSEPPLTTIKCSKDDLGIAAVYDLYSKISMKQYFPNIRTTKKTYMTPVLVKRGSAK